jgi:hypothetical protein
MQTRWQSIDRIIESYGEVSTCILRSRAHVLENRMESLINTMSPY